MTDLILPDKPALELYNYQKNWVQDDSRFKIAMFARQCGKTFTSTLELVLDCVRAEAMGQRRRWVILSRGERQAREFLTIMSSNRGRMYLKHPIMSIKHKFLSMGVDYARYEQQKKLDDKIKAKEKAAKERTKERKAKK